MKAPLGIIGCKLPYNLSNQATKEIKKRVINTLEMDIHKQSYVLITLDNIVGPWIANYLYHKKIDYIVVATQTALPNNKCRHWANKAIDIINIKTDTEEYKIANSYKRNDLEYIYRNIKVIKESESILQFLHHKTNIGKFTLRQCEQELENGLIKSFHPVLFTEQANGRYFLLDEIIKAHLAKKIKIIHKGK
jgi:hypothetical protein